MDKYKFDRYCVRVMGYKTAYAEPINNILKVWTGSHATTYNPYDDLNQMAGVVDVLSSQVEVRNLQGFAEEFATKMINNGIKSTMRDFIISTVQEKDNG